MERMNQLWSSYSFEGSRSFVLAQKLKALKLDLKKWNEQVFDNVEKRKKTFGEMSDVTPGEGGFVESGGES